MSKMIQIRHVPDDVHRVLKMRAASEGMSLSDYLREEITGIAAKPTMREFLARVEKQRRYDFGDEAARIIRELRDAEG